MRLTTHHYQYHWDQDAHLALWRRLPVEWISALTCLIVLHALALDIFLPGTHQPNGSYLALACAGCILALVSAFVNESQVRKLQACGIMLANLIAMFCFY